MRLVKTTDPIRRRRSSSASDDHTIWTSGEEKSQYASPPRDEVIYLGPDPDHTIGEKEVNQVQHGGSVTEGVQDSIVPKEPKLSWTITLLLLASIAVVRDLGGIFIALESYHIP